LIYLVEMIGLNTKLIRRRGK